jgi:hypothetical protein
VEILKYLDVLIGLAVVMVLLSPLVSAFTQLWMWLFNARSGRLQVGLTKIILELNGNPFERFDTAAISSLPPNASVTFAQPQPQPSIATNADAAGNLILTQNVPAILASNGGDLRRALTLPPGGAPAIHLRPRGCGEDWQVTSPATDPQGAATIAYRFTGPPQFAGYQAAANVPAGAVLTVTIGGGTFRGAQLNQAGGVFTYPAHIRPVPCEHDLVLTLTRGGAPVAGASITLTFSRNSDFDQLNPLPAPASFTPKEAETIAESVLLHPMVAQPQFWKLPVARKGEVVEREELIRLLLGFAANPGTSAAMQKLREILAHNDVADPGRALSDIRDAAQRLELTDAAAAAHDRLTRAILLAAQSSFVGRINNWFDHVMDRTTAEYKFRAQLVTIAGALMVAFTVQLDSIDLLKRLSSDDKLRNSLVQQAEYQQKRIDDQSKQAPTGQTQDEIQNAKAQRDEIEGNLAKLRDPQLSILPDHFLWQRLPRARLMRNAAWTPPFSRRLELVVGGSVYPLQPQWSSDPLSAIETAIRNAGAPVKTARDKDRKQFTVTGPNVDKLHLTLGHIDRLAHTGGLAQATLKPTETIGNESFYLLTGYDFPVKVTTNGGAAGLAKAVGDATPAVTVLPGPGFALRAANPQTSWIELRRRAEDHLTNVLEDPVFVGGSAHFDDLLFTGAGDCAIAVEGVAASRAVACDAAKVAAELKNLGFTVAADEPEHLVITSRRLGGVQLRSSPSKPETNMLNGAEEWSCSGPLCFDWDLFSVSWRGVVLTWVLLSLGAPFWYDALKDLLKLRSSLARKEEDARTERQTDTSKTPAKASAR